MPQFALRRDNLGNFIWVVALAFLAGSSVWLPAPDASRGLAGYAPLHTALEVFAIAVAAMVFGIAWTTQRYRPSGRVMILGITFLGVAILDLGHLLSYQGMPDFLTPSGPEKAINFWLAARSLAMLGMLLVPYLPDAWDERLGQTQRWPWLLGLVGLVGGCYVWLLVYPHTLPATFSPETGLTSFKLDFEYVLIAGYLLAALGSLLRLNQEQTIHVSSLTTAALIMAMSEFFFTLYANVTDIYNLLGHLYKILAYGFLYRALFVQTVQAPYEALQRSENNLRREASLSAGILNLEQHALGWTEHELLAAGAQLATQITQSPAACLLWRPQEDTALLPALDGHALLATQRDLTRTALGPWASQAQPQSPWLNNQPDAPARLGLQLGEQAITRILSVASVPDAHRQLLLVVVNARTPYTEAQGHALQMVANTLITLVHQQHQGRTILRLSKALEQSPNPILITNAEREVEYVNQAFTRVSGFTPEEVLGKNPSFLKSGETPARTYQALWARLNVGLNWQGELINRRKDGSRYTERTLIYPIHDSAGTVTHYVSHKEDITEQKATAERIRQLSQYDQLTGLLNRATFDQQMHDALQHASTAGEGCALLWLNLDNFKAINDSLGHTRGDEMLLQVANTLRDVLDRPALVGRHAGDNFLALLKTHDQAAVALLAQTLLDRLQQPRLMDNITISISGSIGVALFPDDALAPEDLTKAAETAMYRVKDEGRNAMRFYAPDMQQHTQRTLAIASALKLAAGRGELFLVYQPQMGLPDNRLNGAEALLRWQHPELGLVSPGEFIPIAEQNGLMVPLGWWVMDTVLRQMQAWQAAGLPKIPVAINVSALQFAQDDLVPRLQNLAQAYGIAPELLEIELTEAVALHNPDAAGDKMRAFSAAGFKIAIDDFGTGYSSMSYLKRFAVHRLKIDQSFVTDLATATDDKAIVRAIIQMAGSLGMSSIAEGVETEAQANVLRALGCDSIQGYWYSRPLEASAFAGFLRHQRESDAPPDQHTGNMADAGTGYE